jgi:hypothetical protein
MRNLSTNAVVSSFSAYANSFSGGVRVATGFFQNTSLPDIVTAPGPGGGTDIRLFTPNGSIIADFTAYPGFNGGVYVAVGDVNGDGTPDIITGADMGGGPHVKVFDGASILKGQVNVLYSFYAYTPTFTGGVRVAAGDVNGDGNTDIITAAGPGGGPHLEVFSGATGARLRSYYAYAPSFNAGVYVAAADVNGDGFADIITGPGVGGGPHLRVFDGTTNGTLLAEAYAFPPTSPGSQFADQSVWSSGLRVATVAGFDPNRPAVIVAPGSGQSPIERLIDPLTMTELNPPGQLSVFSMSFLGGIFVAGD